MKKFYFYITCGRMTANRGNGWIKCISTEKSHIVVVGMLNVTTHI